MLNKDPLEKYYKKIKAHKISKRDIGILLGKFNNTKRRDYKQDIGVCLSLIKKDSRIPKILLNSKTIKENINYSPTILLTYGHLYHNYPEIRENYLEMMYKSNLHHRTLLSLSLAFVMSQYPDVRRQVVKFYKQEKNEKIKQKLRLDLNIEKRLKILRSIVNKLDPTGLIKKDHSKDFYDECLFSIIGYEYKNISELVTRIKKIFTIKFKDQQIIVEDYADKIANDWDEYLKNEKI